ncbi:MAG: SDR family oxidoreductase [archaeon]
MNSLQNKNVLVTGSSSGIGESIAEKFAEQKANVGIHYCHNKKGAFDLAKKLAKLTKVKVYCQDLESDKLDLVHQFIKDFGSIDILINNAGIPGSESFFDMSSKDYDKIFKINSRSAFILAKDAFQYMKKNKFGRIINISSFAVKYGRGRNDSIQYAATKATLETLTTGLSILGAEYNILVNAIRPGIIMTKLQKNRKDLDKRIKLIPLKRAGNVDDISDLVVYLASEKGDFITGQIISVSGGE